MRAALLLFTKLRIYYLCVCRAFKNVFEIIFLEIIYDIYYINKFLTRENLILLMSYIWQNLRMSLTGLCEFCSINIFLRTLLAVNPARRLHRMYGENLSTRELWAFLENERNWIFSQIHIS